MCSDHARCLFYTKKIIRQEVGTLGFSKFTFLIFLCIIVIKEIPMRNKDKLSYIILGLLRTEPMSGYDLKKKFESEVGEFWQANTGQIYPSLKVLLNDKAVTYDVEIVGEKLEKKTYRITAYGEELFNTWLTHAVDRYPIQKDEFMLRLYFMDTDNEENMRKLVSDEREVHQKKLNYLLQRKAIIFGDDDTAQKSGHYLVLDFAIQRDTMNIEWLSQLSLSFDNKKDQS